MSSGPTSRINNQAESLCLAARETVGSYKRTKWEKRLSNLIDPVNSYRPCQIGGWKLIGRVYISQGLYEFPLSIYSILGILNPLQYPLSISLFSGSLAWEGVQLLLESWDILWRQWQPGPPITDKGPSGRVERFNHQGLGCHHEDKLGVDWVNYQENCNKTIKNWKFHQNMRILPSKGDITNEP